MIRPAPVLSALVACAAICAAVWGLWHWVIWLPDETNRLRDDAFYEFAWAANVASGRGPTVSDGITTSGVQWLWSLLLVPVAWFAGAVSLPTVAPMLGLVLHVVTSWLVGRLPRDALTGLCLALCWLGHPLLLREAQNGQETALAVFFAVILFSARRVREPCFALLSVLTVLARSDLLALVVLLSFCRHWHAGGLVGPAGLRGLLRALPSPLLAFALPLIGNLMFGGGWLPDSALPMAWLWHANLTATGSFLEHQWWFTRPVLLGGPFAMASTFGFGLVAFLLIRPWWPVALRVVPAVVVGGASALGVHDLLTAGWAALLLALFPAVRLRRLPCELLALTLGLGAIVVLHWALRWYPRDYYLAPLVLVAFVAMARLGRWRILLLAFAIVQLQDSWRVKPEPLAGQQEMAMAGAFLRDVVPIGERVGCFNSGLVTWLADVTAAPGERRGIVNLDGVVDARSFAALKAGRLSAWLDQQDVRFLLDIPTQFERDPSVPHACGLYFGGEFDAERDLVEIARFDVPGVSGSLPRADSMRLYWRRGRGQMPARPVAEGQTYTFGQLSMAAMKPGDLWWGASAGQALVLVGPDGTRTTLASTDVATAVLLRLAPEQLRSGHIEIESR